MIRNTKSQQSYRKKIQNIGNPFIGQVESRNVQNNLNSLLLKEDKSPIQLQKQYNSHDVQNKQNTSLNQSERIQSPQSNRQKKSNSFYSQIVRSENPLHINGSNIHQQPLQNSSTIQQKFLDNDAMSNNSPWIGIRREQIRTASPSQGRKHNIFKDYFNTSENIYQMQGFQIKNNNSQLNSQMNNTHNQQNSPQIMQQSFNLQSQNQFNGNSPFQKNNIYQQQGLFFNQVVNKPFYQQMQQSQNNFVSVNPSLVDQNHLISIQNSSSQQIFNSRPYAYTSHRMFRPQKLGLVSKHTSNQELKQVTTNNNNSNYYYLTDKNKDWNQVKNSWIGSLSGCLFSQAVKVNDNTQLKNKNILSYSQKKKKYLTKEVSKSSAINHFNNTNQQKEIPVKSPLIFTNLQIGNKEFQSRPQLQISQKMIFNKA